MKRREHRRRARRNDEQTTRKTAAGGAARRPPAGGRRLRQAARPRRSAREARDLADPAGADERAAKRAARRAANEGQGGGGVQGGVQGAAGKAVRKGAAGTDDATRRAEEARFRRVRRATGASALRTAAALGAVVDGWPTAPQWRIARLVSGYGLGQWPIRYFQSYSVVSDLASPCVRRAGARSCGAAVPAGPGRFDDRFGTSGLRPCRRLQPTHPTAPTRPWR